VAKSDLGTKRVCPETGRKFYDLNRDPIVSPYTGISYPRSYFESGAEHAYAADEVEEEEDLETVAEKAEFVPLEDADSEEAGGDDDLPDLDDEEVDLGDEEGDTFLEEEEEEDGDDVSGIIGGGRGGDDDEV